jgi:uncharacterized protein YceK
MTKSALALVTALAVAAGLAGCGATRTVQFEYTKHDTTEMRMRQDVDELKGTSGVVNVIPHIDASNNVQLDVYLDEDDSNKGAQKALELGYQQVRN